MSEAQDAQERVHRAVRGFVGDVDRRFLRPMQMKMHLCAADVCKDTESSMEKSHARIEKCQEEASRAQNYMQAEMQRFQVCAAFLIIRIMICSPRILPFPGEPESMRAHVPRSGEGQGDAEHAGRGDQQAPHGLRAVRHQVLR